MRTYLLLKLLEDATTDLSLNYFVEELGVSKRTVQNELAYLRKDGDTHGYTLRSSYGKGYSLEIQDQKQLDAFLAELYSDDAVLNEETLIIKVLSVILTASQEYTSVAELSEKLGLSATVLYAKLDTVATFVGSYSLKLERRSHYGVKLAGTGSAVRGLMLDLYMKGENDFKTIVDDRVGNFDEYERLSEDCIRQQHLRIGYYEFQRLMAWLKILIVYATDWPVPKQQVTVNEARPIDSCITNSLSVVLRQVAKSFRFSVSAELEREFGKLVRESAQKSDVPGIVIDTKELGAKLLAFFSASDLKHHTDYAGDSEFINRLTTHLSFLFARLDEKITYKNPLLLELCIRYPMVFDLVLKFSEFLNAQFGIHISNDELGFIAVHFLNHDASEKNRIFKRYERVAVICTTGGGVSNLVRTQILGIFPNQDVRAFSFWEEQDIQDFRPNLIFSVIPLKREPQVPIIYIHELLSHKDIANIKRMLFIDGLPPDGDARLNVTNEYLALIRPELFSVVQGDCYTDLIQAMAHQITAEGYGDKDYEPNVMLREQFMSTIYNNGIAMPHPIEMKGKKSAIAVAIVKPTLIEDEREIKIIFMVCLAKEDLHYYSNISNGIFNLMQDSQLISKVYEQPMLTTLVNTLRGLED